MNIGIVTTWFERGAAYVSKQYLNLLQDENNVFIYARGGENYAINDENWDKPNVTWGKKIGSNVVTEIDIKDFKKWLLDNKIEAVLFNEQRWMKPVILCSQLGIKTISYIDYYREDTIEHFWCYDVLICNTKRHLETFKWHPQVYYIPWGTDIEIFKPEKRNTEEGYPVFFHSCGLNPVRKGTDFLIEAFSQIKSKNKKLIIHSQCNVFERLPIQAEKIKKLIDEGCLEYIEKTVTAPGLYHLGDVYVYPSRLDGIGLTIAEALSCGLPVITNDEPPFNEFVTRENGKLNKIEKYYCRADGYYWPLCESSIVSLRENLEFYIDNFDKIDEIKVECRKYAEENLDWAKNKEAVCEVVRNSIILNDENKQKYLSLLPKIEKKQDLIIKFCTYFSFIYKFAKNMYKKVK